MNVTPPPSAMQNLFSIGMARAKWIVATDAALGGSTAFIVAWLLQPIANYGLAGRFNTALRNAGSTHQVSPIVCFLFAGMPFFGAVAQFRNGVAALQSARGGAPAAAA